MSQGIRDGAAVRRERMMMILEFVRSNPGASVDRIQREIAWRTGLTPKRISHYIMELVELKRLRAEGQGFKVADRA